MDYESSVGTKHTLTRKQMIWGAAAVGLVLLYMNPWVIRMFISPFLPSQQVRVVTKVAPAPPPPAKQDTVATPPALGVDPVGKWYGQNVVKDRGNCQLGLEVSPKLGQVNQYSAYSSLTCVDYTESHGKIGLSSLKKILEEQRSSASTVLSGNVENGSLVFQLQNAIDSANTKCTLSKMTLTPFGTGVVKVVWTDSCGTGEIGLTKAHS